MTGFLSQMSAAGNRFLIADARPPHNRFKAFVRPNPFAGLFSLEKTAKNEVQERLRRLHSLFAGKKSFDGLIIASKKRRGLSAWTFFNRDGSTASMCGNGAAVTALYRQTLQKPESQAQKFIFAKNALKGRWEAGRFWIEMPDPSPIEEHVFVFQGKSFAWKFVSPGTPHGVLLWNQGELSGKALRPIARALRKIPLKNSHGMNVSFYQKTASKRVLRAVTYERGVEDFTSACGTGAAAAALAAFQKSLTGQEVSVQMPGGELKVRLTNPVQLASPAQWGWD